MLALLALLIPPSEADKVLERNAKFMATVQSLSVDIDVTLVAPPFKGSGKLTVQFPRRTRFDIKLGPSNYSLAASEESVLEIEHSTKYYMEDLPADFVGVPASKISSAPQAAFPSVLLRRSLKMYLPEGAVFSHLGRVGTQDKLKATWQSSSGAGEATAFIDGQGKLTRLTWKAQDFGQPIGNDMRFTNYAVNRTIPMSTFRLRVPTGYVPYALPIDRVPPETGTKVKLGTWYAAGPGQIDLDKELAGKPALLFVMSPDCVPSQRARAMVEALSKEVRVVELLSDTWNGARSSRPKYLWGGDALKFLAPPVTPSFYLISGDGTLHRFWYGYEEQSRKEYEEDIRASIKEVR